MTLEYLKTLAFLTLLNVGMVFCWETVHINKPGGRLPLIQIHAIVHNGATMQRRFAQEIVLNEPLVCGNRDFHHLLKDYDLVHDVVAISFGHCCVAQYSESSK